MTDRLWTLDEAQRFLPEARSMLEEAREAAEAARKAHEGVDAMVKEHGDLVAEVEHPDHPAYAVHREALATARSGFEAAMGRLAGAGLEVKAIEPALLDFRAEMAGRVVYLCWADGEEGITHWHTLDGGFAARRPIPALRL